MAYQFPDYDDLPRVEGMPQGCAWGIFDKSGKKDVFGCLNKISPELVKEAALEIQEGTSVSLNWSLGAFKKPSRVRKGLTHKVISFLPTRNFHAFDDEVSFNTQCSSQWDSLCHYFHQESVRGYNGVRPTVEDLEQPWGSEDKEMRLPTMNHWHERGGLVGRGVLIDFKAYAEAKGIPFDPFDNYRITPAEIEETAKFQGLSFKPGDVLIVRTGFTEALTNVPAEEQARLLGIGKAAGVDPTEDSARWLWNKHFSAVASDNIAFETKLGGERLLILHQYLLSLFGLNIGELWDLTALAKHCAASKRYSFFFTSCPINVAGAVASPPNAIATF